MKIDDLVSKPSRVFRNAYSTKDTGDFRRAGRNDEGLSVHELRQMKAAALARSRQRGFLLDPLREAETEWKGREEEDDDDEDEDDDDQDEPPPESMHLTRTAKSAALDPDDFEEKEAQDWISEERDVQRMLGISDAADLYS